MSPTYDFVEAMADGKANRKREIESGRCNGGGKVYKTSAEKYGYMTEMEWQAHNGEIPF